MNIIFLAYYFYSFSDLRYKFYTTKRKQNANLNDIYLCNTQKYLCLERNLESHEKRAYMHRSVRAVNFTNI
jgi:hypothetical protein